MMAPHGGAGGRPCGAAVRDRHARAPRCTARIIRDATLPAQPSDSTAREEPMDWIDATLPLNAALAAWPGDDPFAYRETLTLRAGDDSNCASIALGVHCGTHLDAPYHYIDGGTTVDRIDPELLIGPCLVIDLRDAGPRIARADLAGKVPPGTRRLLVKTRNGAFLRDRAFHEDYTAFSQEAAEWLAARGVRLLGIDYFSIAPFDDPRPVHLAILGAGGAALEGVDLAGAAPGAYEIICLPLRIEGSGGAPARVLLRRAAAAAS